MSFTLPYSIETCYHMEGVFQIRPCNKSGLVAFLSQYKLYICDSGKINCPLITKYELTEKQIQAYGPLYWVQWFDTQSLAFGTCYGIIFIAEIISEQNIITISGTYDINAPITSVFAAYNHLAICQNNSKIIFITKSGRVSSEIDFNREGSRFSSVEYIYPKYFSGIYGGVPVVAFIDQNTIENKSQFLFNFENITNAKLCAYCPSKSALAYSLDDNSVKITIVGMTTETTANITPPSDDHVNKLYWSKDGRCLFIFFSTGKVVLFLANVSERIIYMMPELENAVEIGFDSQTQQLFISDLKSVTCIHLAENNHSLLYSPGFLFDLRAKKTIGKIGGESSLPNELYPIMYAIRHQNNYAAANKNGIVIKFDDLISNFIPYKMKNMGFCGQYLFVFGQSVKRDDITWFSCNVFDKSFKSVAYFEIKHTPTHISAYGSTLLVSCHNNYTYIDITNETSPIPLGKKFIKLETIKNEIPISIIGSAIGEGRRAFILYQDRSVISFPSNELVAKDVRCIWNSDCPELTVAQKYDSSILFYQNVSFTLSNTAYFNDIMNIYSLSPNQIVGAINSFSQNYISAFIAEFRTDNEKSKSIYDLLKRYDNIPQIYSSAIQIIFNRKESKVEELFSCIAKILTPEELAETISNAFRSLKFEQRQTIFAQKCLKWEQILNNLQANDATRLIMNVHPKNLYEFLKGIKFNDGNSILKYLLKISTLIPIFIFCDVYRINFGDIVDDIDGYMAARSIRIDKNRLDNPHFVEFMDKIKVFVMQHGNYRLLYAILLSTNDVLSQQIEIDHPEDKEELDKIKNQITYK